MAGKDSFKEQFAMAAAEAFRATYPDVFQATGREEVFDPAHLFDLLEKPKDVSMGWFALPVFRFARLLKDKPPGIAQAVVEHLTTNGAGANFAATATGGFINVQVDPDTLADDTLATILSEEAAYGQTTEGNGSRVLVEYSSCNIAKPFGIAHLRTTVIGNSLRRVFKKLGYDVVGINYLGDWGTQFGKMIVAYRLWGRDLDLSTNAVEKLYNLYVRFHAEAESDDTLNDQAREAFKRLEEGAAEETALWQRFRDLSLAEFMRVYDHLGVEFDWITGEAFLNDKMSQIIERLEAANLTAISEGAQVVHLDDTKLPPLLLKKADGATLYATRDLAGLVYRWETYQFEESLYVVATSQADHFKQAFKVIEMLEDAENVPAEHRMTGKVKHVDFGWVKFGEEQFSTRKGNIIFLEDVITKAAALARSKIEEKNPNLKSMDETADLIGIGAVIFSQFMAKRQKDIRFDWDAVLNFEGETGPYLQYTHARLCSLLRKYGGEAHSDIDVKLLASDEERLVVRELADFPEAIADARRNYDPYFIGAHLLRLAGAFNRVYQRKDADGKIEKIISNNAELTAARIALVKAVQLVIKEGLHLLGVSAPDEM